MNILFSLLFPLIFLPWQDVASNAFFYVQNSVRVRLPRFEKVEAAIGGPLIIDAPLNIRGGGGAFTAVRFSDAANSAYFIEPAATGNALILAGKVGIGTTTPGSMLHVVSPTNPQLYLDYEIGGGATSLYSNGNNDLVIDPAGGDTTIDSNLSLNTGLLRAGNGTTAIPSISFDADSDIGMYRAGTNTLGFSTAGAERLRIDSSGRVGIGTTAPTDPLHVVLPAVGTNSYFKITSSGGNTFSTYLGTTAANQYAWFTNIRYNGSAFVRDDTSKAAWRMTQVVDTGSDYSGFYINHWNPTGTMFTPFFLSGTGDYNFNENDVYFQNTTGNVGIGTTNPAGKLDLVGTSSDVNLNLQNTTGSPAIQLSNSSSYFRFLISSGVSYLQSGTSSSSDSKADIRFTSIGAVTPWMTIQGSSGNVGIGTTTPLSTLDIGGFGTTISSLTNAKLGIADNLDGVSGVQMYNASSGTAADSRFLVTDNVKDQYLALTMPGTGNTASALFGRARNSLALLFLNNVGDGTERNLAIGTVHNTDVILGSNNTEVITIKNSGLVGIGTSAPGSKLHVVGGANDVFLVEDDSGACEAQPTTTGLTWSCSSDIRLKKDIRNPSSQLPYLLNIPLKDYTVIKTGERVTGPIAQEVQQTYPELVSQGDDGYLQVSELSSWMVIKAIQELYQKIVGNGAHLQKQIDEQQKIIEDLRGQVDILRKTH